MSSNNSSITNNCSRLVVSASEYDSTLAQKRYKYNFIEPAIKQIIDFEKSYNKGTIKWLISSTGYSSTDISNFKNIANKLGVEVVFFEDRHEFKDIINEYSDSSMKIDKITIFSHGIVGAVAMRYAQDNYKYGAHLFQISDIEDIKTDAISSNCYTMFYSCNTATPNEDGTSFAKEWQNGLDGTVKATVNKTDYSCILGRSDSEINTHLKEMEDKGYSDNGAMYYPQLDSESNVSWKIFS